MADTSERDMFGSLDPNFRPDRRPELGGFRAIIREAVFAAMPYPKYSEDVLRRAIGETGYGPSDRTLNDYLGLIVRDEYCFMPGSNRFIKYLPNLEQDQRLDATNLLVEAINALAIECGYSKEDDREIEVFAEDVVALMSATAEERLSAEYGNELGILLKDPWLRLIEGDLPRLFLDDSRGYFLQFDVDVSEDDKKHGRASFVLGYKKFEDEDPFEEK